MTSWRKSDDDGERDQTAAVGLAEVKTKTKDFAEPFRSANAWVPAGTPVYTNRMTYWEPIPWGNLGGRISLAGDAAHPMTFRMLFVLLSGIKTCTRSLTDFLTDRAQGLNHAIEDAAKYVAALRAVEGGQGELEDAIDGYETEMIARGGEEVRLSKRNTEMVHQWDKLMQSPLFQKGVKRNALAGSLPEQLTTFAAHRSQIFK